MKAQLLTATLFTTFSGVLSAADPMLLNLVMPDAKVVAGVNVQQAKGTLFGQYILSQMQTTDAHMRGGAHRVRPAARRDRATCGLERRAGRQPRT